MKYFGIFYKDNGKWRGPYEGLVTSKKHAKSDLKYLKPYLKKKLELREMVSRKVK